MEKAQAGRRPVSQQTTDELAQRILAVITWSFDELHEAMNALAIHDQGAIDELAICIASEIETTLNNPSDGSIPATRELPHGSRADMETCVVRWLPVTQPPATAMHGRTYLILRDIPKPKPRDHKWMQQTGVYHADFQHFIAPAGGREYTDVHYYWNPLLPDSYPQPTA